MAGAEKEYFVPGEVQQQLSSQPPDDTVEAAGESARDLSRSVSSSWSTVDTNAVMCPAPKDLVLMRVALPYIAPGIFIPYVWTVSVAMGLGYVANSVQQSAATELERFFDLSVAMSIPASAITTATSLRRVTRHQGELSQLGAGSVKISQDYRDAIAWRQRVGFLWFCLMVAIGVVNTVGLFRIGETSAISGRVITPFYAVVIALTTLLFGNLAMGGPWLVSLKVATLLVSDQLDEIGKGIENYEPSSAGWEEVVVKGLVYLCEHTFPLLSSGWGDTLGVIFAANWLLFIGAAGLYTETKATGLIGVAFLCLFYPLAVSFEGARTSSRCAEISDALNRKRHHTATTPWLLSPSVVRVLGRGKRMDVACKGSDDKDVEHAIRRLETLMDRQNKMKGTGFQVFGVVFNLQTWGKGVSVALSVMLSIAPIILARANDIRNSGAAPCEVSDTLRAAIEAIIVAHEDGNCSVSACDYGDVTLGSLLNRV